VEERSLDFESFYRGEYPQVYRAARLATGNHDRALDATQEAFKRAPLFGGRASERNRGLVAGS
jgi:DNA-directed RNA polymerase specialized sigma24 family protein